ncbi:dihydrofolate reductase family protein [Spongiactinospora sp. 9N601]|uniref:dihydrofolate reductase family protein n=1 Tax=Spongiactinospora sp. 9N601 TaxID=3375149 RepID=UPI00379EFB46
MFGSGTLIRALAEHGLIDEYRLLVFPIVIRTCRGRRASPGSARRPAENPEFNEPKLRCSS